MELKVISFNIRCCDDKDGNTIAERAPRLYEITKKYDADIIGFQEYTDAWSEHIESYYSNYEMFNKFRAESDHESCPILWKRDKLECLDKGYFWLSSTPEVESRGWDELYNCFRICEYVILKDKQSGKVFTYMNTHYGFGDKGQMDSGELIYNYSKKISSNPTLITGDFNMNPDSKGYEVMSRHFTDVNAVTAKDTRTTYHGYGKADNAHIDYCFINDGIKPINQTMIDEKWEEMYPTDHYGLFIELEI